MEIFELPQTEDLQSEQIEYLQKQKQEFKHIGKLRKVPGHTLFSFNRKTKEIKPAAFEHQVSMGFDKKVHREIKCFIEPDCFYEQALNRKNFIKRLKRYGLL